MATALSPVSEAEWNMQFHAGHWWLNIACAHRDGIVGSALEQPTKHRYGVAVLPLLTGTEEATSGGLVKYIREGSQQDMHVPLISQVGREIGILRGYRLRSIYAPPAGIRYDGLYRIRQWGQKLDLNTNTYRLELILERSKGQRSMEEIKKVPKPSELDDWYLYQKLESDFIRQSEGGLAMLDWKIKMEKERVDREDWRRMGEFRSSLSMPSSRLRTTTNKLLATKWLFGAGRSRSPEPDVRRPSVFINDTVPETPL